MISDGGLHYFTLYLLSIWSYHIILLNDKAPPIYKLAINVMKLCQPHSSSHYYDDRISFTSENPYVHLSTTEEGPPSSNMISAPFPPEVCLTTIAKIPL